MRLAAAVTILISALAALAWLLGHYPPGPGPAEPVLPSARRHPMSTATTGAVALVGDLEVTITENNRDLAMQSLAPPGERMVEVPPDGADALAVRLVELAQEARRRTSQRQTGRASGRPDRPARSSSTRTSSAPRRSDSRSAGTTPIATSPPRRLSRWG